VSEACRRGNDYPLGAASAACKIRSVALATLPAMISQERSCSARTTSGVKLSERGSSTACGRAVESRLGAGADRQSPRSKPRPQPGGVCRSVKAHSEFATIGYGMITVSRLGGRHPPFRTPPNITSSEHTPTSRARAPSLKDPQIQTPPLGSQRPRVEQARISTIRPGLRDDLGAGRARRAAAHRRALTDRLLPLESHFRSLT